MEQIIESLQSVYDPEFPLIDIYTMGLIYHIDFNEDEKKIHLLLTFTSPACPMADMILQMIENAVQQVYPDFLITMEVTFDPPREPSMIRDQDLQKMFL